MTLTLFAGCDPQQEEGGINSGWQPNSKQLNVSSDSLYVQKVENLPDDFIMGMDASCVPSLEAGGAKY